MRKTPIFIILFVLVFALTACGGAGDDPTQKNNEKEAGTQPANTNEAGMDAAGIGFELTISEGGEPAPLVEWMKGGTFSFEFNSITTIGDDVSYKTGRIYADQGKAKIVFYDQYDGKANNLTNIIKDGVAYTFVDLSKLIAQTPYFGAVSTNGIITDYRGIGYSSSGEGTIAGKTLPFDEYDYGDSGGAVRFYFDDGRVVGLESEIDFGAVFKTEMVIRNPKSSVPADAFDFPKGYVLQESAVMKMLEYPNEDMDEGYTE